jgi:hypothetical protein
VGTKWDGRCQQGTRPHRIRSRVRDPVFGSYRTMGRLSVGATFQLGAKFGAGYSGGIRNAILISDTSVSSLAVHTCSDLSIDGRKETNVTENV